MFDPSVQYLTTCSPIGTPRLAHISRDNEAQRKDLEEYQRKQRLKVPSPSSHVDEKKPFSMDQLVPKSKEDQQRQSEEAKTAKLSAIKMRKARAVQVAPSVALYNQKMKRVSKL